MSPDPWKVVEVGPPILGPVRVIPEHHGHGGEGLGANQLAFAPGGPADLVEDLHLHPEAQGLQLAPEDRADGIARGKRRNEVCSSRDRREAKILFDVPINVVKAGRRPVVIRLRESRAGGSSHGYARDGAPFSRPGPGTWHWFQTLSCAPLQPGRKGSPGGDGRGNRRKGAGSTPRPGCSRASSTSSSRRSLHRRSCCLFSNPCAEPAP